MRILQKCLVGCLLSISLAQRFEIRFAYGESVQINLPASSLYDITAISITGAKVNLNQFKGSVSLVVNTASNCGFASQLEDLEKIYQKYLAQGFVVLAFPSNDFMGQEPRSNQEIANFCTQEFGVTFPIFDRAEVTGSNKQPVYKFLTEQGDANFRGDPGWNFIKFLVDKRGVVRDRFGSTTNPQSSSITDRIEELLKE